MDTVAIAALVLALSLLALLGAGVWIALSLLTAGLIVFTFFAPLDPGSILSSTMWDASWNWALTALPLFVWMGEISHAIRPFGQSISRAFALGCLDAGRAFACECRRLRGDGGGFRLIRRHLRDGGAHEHSGAEIAQL